MTVLVFAGGVALQFRDARMAFVVPGGVEPPFQTDQPALVGWLARFARPTAVEDAIGELPPPSQPLAGRAIAYLERTGALVPAQAAAASDADPEAAHALTRKALLALPQDVYELACDALGLGPYAERAIAARDGLALATRIQAVRDAIGALRAELAALRGPYLRQQLEALRIAPDATGLQLHIGCGPHLLPGWVNIDVHPAPLATNLLWGLPFADGSVQLIYSAHLLEHLFYPTDVQSLLAEMHRVLAPGGRVRIVVPDIEKCIEAYQARDAAFFDGRRRHWGGGSGQPTRLEDFLAYAGAGPDPATLFESHKFGYDFETLERALQRAGFAWVERSRFQASTEAALRIDDRSQVAGARFGDQTYSLFVEAGNDAGGTPA